MHKTIIILVATLRETFLSRASQHLENLALRQQVAIPKRDRRRPYRDGAYGHEFRARLKRTRLPLSWAERRRLLGFKSRTPPRARPATAQKVMDTKIGQETAWPFSLREHRIHGLSAIVSGRNDG